MSKPLSRSEVNAFADDLRKMLAAIDAGHLVATAATRHRIEGAIAVIDAVQGRAARFPTDSD
jgi:hypothetical protein